MFEEDDPYLTFKTATENHFFWQLFILCSFSFWALGGNTTWALTFVIAMGMVGILFQFTHHAFGHNEQNPGISIIVRMWPLWFNLIIALVGLYFSPFETFTVDKTLQYSLSPGPWWLPVTTAAGSFWIPLLFKASLLIIAYNVLVIAESHFMLKRLMLFLAANAIGLAAFGYTWQILDITKILFFITPPHPKYFATFTHPDHWGAFALLWSMVGLAIILQSKRRHSWQGLLAHGGSWKIAGTGLLIATLFTVPSPLYRGLFCIGLGVILVHIGMCKFKQITRKAANNVLALFLTVAGLVVITAAIATQIQSWLVEPKTINQFTPVLTPTSLCWSYKLALYRDAWSAFLAKPIFGWGDNSFSYVMAFYQNADTSDYYFASAHSDMLHILVEHGILGAATWLFIPGYYLIKFLTLKTRRSLSYYLLGTCGLGLIASFTDFPFQNPAFTISFWVILFTAYRWSEIGND